jgi:hypothetical protein
MIISYSIWHKCEEHWKRNFGYHSNNEQVTIGVWMILISEILTLLRSGLSLMLNK